MISLWYKEDYQQLQFATSVSFCAHTMGKVLRMFATDEKLGDRSE